MGLCTCLCLMVNLCVHAWRQSYLYEPVIEEADDGNDGHAKDTAPSREEEIWHRLGTFVSALLTVAAFLLLPPNAVQSATEFIRNTATDCIGVPDPMAALPRCRHILSGYRIPDCGISGFGILLGYWVPNTGRVPTFLTRWRRYPTRCRHGTGYPIAVFCGVSASPGYYSYVVPRGGGITGYRNSAYPIGIGLPDPVAVNGVNRVVLPNGVQCIAGSAYYLDTKWRPMAFSGASAKYPNVKDVGTRRVPVSMMRAR